jgi:hypothetical protein
MTRRGLLNIDDSIYKSLPMITGPAKSYLRLKVHDSTAADSLTQ